MFAARTVIVVAARRHAGHAVAGLLPAWRATRVAAGRGAARRRSGGAQAAAPVAARSARLGVADRPPGRAARRLGRRARPPQRHAPPGPHGGHRGGADDRRRAGDRVTVVAEGLRDTTQGSLDAAHRGRPRDHRRGRLVADRSGARRRRSARRPGVQAITAPAPGRRARVRRQGDRQRRRPGDGRRRVLVRLDAGRPRASRDARRATARSSTRAGPRSTTSASATASRSRSTQGRQARADACAAIEDSPVLDPLGLGPITISQAAFDARVRGAARPPDAGRDAAPRPRRGAGARRPTRTRKLQTKAVVHRPADAGHRPAARRSSTSCWRWR